MKTFNVHSPAGEVEESPAERGTLSGQALVTLRSGSPSRALWPWVTVPWEPGGEVVLQGAKCPCSEHRGPEEPCGG
jgi:hypothetical protein